MTSDATAPVDPAISVRVDDVEAAHRQAQERGYEIVHPLTTEEWGVTRFFVRAPDGNVLNVVQDHERFGGRRCCERRSCAGSRPWPRAPASSRYGVLGHRAGVASVDELSRHHGDFCLQTMPRASPDSHGFGTEAAASNAPGLWKPQEAWVVAMSLTT